MSTIPKTDERAEWRLKMLAERDSLSDQIRLIQKRIDRLKDRQLRMRTDRNKLTKQLSDSKTGNQRSGMSDTHEVLCSDIQEYVLEWMQEYNAGQQGGYGAVLQLSLLSGVSTKTISRIVRGLQECCTVSTAEMIMSAIGQGWIVSTLEWRAFKRGRTRARPNDPPPTKFYEE